MLECFSEDYPLVMDVVIWNITKKLGRMLGLTYHGNGNYHFMEIVIVMEVLIENIQYTIQTID